MNLDLTLQAAKDFKKSATELVHMLCSKAAVESANPDRNYVLRKKYGKQREHILDDEWHFCLHGAECRFTNKKTNRVIEVIMTNGEEYGTLDAYFFYLFCKGSSQYQELAEYYGGSTDKIVADFKVLLSKRELRKVSARDSEINRNVTA